MESTKGNAAEHPPTDALLTFIVQVGSLLLGTDIDVIDSGLRNADAEESLVKFITDSDTAALEVSIIENQGMFASFASPQL